MTLPAPKNTSSKAVFASGSIMRHLLVMTATSSIGLMAIFAVDLLNLFYISQLGIEELAAAVGFAGTLMFFTTSIAIGLSIATAAVVSKAMGENNQLQATRMASASLGFMALNGIVTVLVIWPFLRPLLSLLGATGETLELATVFLQIVIPSFPLLAIGMGASGVLRGLGDAKRSMYVTLSAGVATAILDPIFIFGFDMGLIGAAWASALSRVALLATGLLCLHFPHRILSMPDWKSIREVRKPYFAIAIPAVLTQVSTPIGNAYVTYAVAGYGDDAVAGWAVIGRIIPVAFAPIFAMSGAVAPILGQNFGAKQYDRLMLVVREALILAVLYVAFVWAILIWQHTNIADGFDATGQARDLIAFFCIYIAGSFMFNGALFIANSAFNNLGHPSYSTLFNWGRSTLGTIPFVWLGAYFIGAKGIFIGWAIGGIVFGLLSIYVCIRVIAKIAKSDGRDIPPPSTGDIPAAANSPFSSGKASTL